MKRTCSSLGVLALLVAPGMLAQTSSIIIAGGGPADGTPATIMAVGTVQGVAADGSGNLYFSSASQNRVYKLAFSGGISVVAGSGISGFSGDGGSATTAQLNAPEGIAIDSLGNLYIADTGNNRIRKVTGGVISTVAGNGSLGYAGDGLPATSASMSSPQGVTVDASFNFYIADTGNCRVRKVSGGIISTVAGNGTCDYSGDGGLATNAKVGYGISGIVVDGFGNLYIADANNYRIRKVSGAIITTVAGNGSPGYSGDGGPAALATIGYSHGVATDASGNLYIDDTTNCRIRKVSGGIITTVAGNGTCGFSGDGGATTAGQISTSYGVAVDRFDDIFISDTGINYRIREVSPGFAGTSAVIFTVAGNGTFRYSGDGRAATAAQLSPGSVAADALGNNLYIADFQDHRVRKVSGGQISTAAGTGAIGFSGDGGLAVNAAINDANGLAVDFAGNWYIADSANCRVRKVTAAGVITNFAGNGTCGYLGDGGAATNAQVSPTGGIAADSLGNVFISDFTNNRIRKISGGIITLYSGAGLVDGSTATNVSLPGAGVAVDTAGNTYVASPNLNRVFKISSIGVLSTFAGVASGGFSGDTGSAILAQLSAPTGVAVDSSGSVYIYDSGNLRIRKVTGGVISSYAGGGFGCAQQTDLVGDNCPPTSASIGSGQGIAVDTSGNLYIGDGNSRIRKVSGGIITTVAGNGTSGYSGDTGAATSAQISGNVEGVAVSGTNLFIADTGNNRVRKVSGSGMITTFAGNGTFGYAGDGGAATSAELAAPFGVAVDAGGNVFIADSINNRIRKVSVSGGIISTVAGGGVGCVGQTDPVGDGCSPTNGKLGFIIGIALDSAGSNVYVADGNFRIRKFGTGASPIITTVGGNGLYSFSGDGGAALNAQVGSPAGLAVDGANNLYIADTGNSRIRLISGGTISTFAGGGTQGIGDGIAATNATLSSPRAVAVDTAAGTVYLGDSGTRLVRKVSGGIINTVTTFAAGGSFPFSSDGGIAVDSLHRLYVADPPDGRVRMLASSIPVLGIAKTHTGNLFQGQSGATYTVTVSNAGTSSTTGTVTVFETLPTSLMLISMSGTGWTCPVGGTTCVRSDVLTAGASYPAITVTVSVPYFQPPQVVNQVCAGGGGAGTVCASDPTIITNAAPAKAAIFRAGLWVFDLNGDGQYGAGDRFSYLGQAGDIPVVGDWNGDGRAKMGIFRDGLWVLDYNGNGQWDGPAGGDRFFFLGQAGDIPVVGDWNGDGRMKAGIFRAGFWVLDYNGNGQWDGPAGGDRFFFLGQALDTPVVGDWNGDGRAKAGIFRAGLWVLDYNGNGQWDGPPTDRFFTLGQAGDTPVVGDWNGDGRAKAGIFRAGLWVLDYNGNGLWDGPPSDRFFTLGQAGDTPIVGDWNGDGRAKAAIFRAGFWVFDKNGNGLWDGPPGDLFMYLGQAGDTAVPAKW